MTISISQTIDIDVDAATAWAIIADYSNDRRWRSGVISMESTPTGPVEAGTTTHEVIKVAGKTWTNFGVVTSVEPGHKFWWRTTSGAQASGSRQVSNDADGRSRVSLELQVTPTGIDRLTAPIAGLLLRRGLRKDSITLRALLADSEVVQ